MNEIPMTTLKRLLKNIVLATFRSTCGTIIDTSLTPLKLVQIKKFFIIFQISKLIKVYMNF